jgi:hypothetical protein
VNFFFVTSCTWWPLEGLANVLVSSRNGVKYLTTALAVHPFEEPGIGPNCDDNVLYQIHVATGTDVAKGKPTLFLRPTLRPQIAG